MTAESPSSDGGDARDGLQSWQRDCVPILRWLAGGLIAATVGVIGSRLLNPLPTTEYRTVTLVAVYGGALATAALCVWLQRRWSSPPPAPRPATDARPQSEPAESTPEPVPAIPAGPAADQTDHPTLTRIRNVLGQHFSDVYIRDGSVEINPDNDTVRAFDLRTTTPAGFTDGAFRERLYQRIADAIPGVWKFQPDTLSDLVRWQLKDGFPSLIATPPTKVAHSTQDALDLYPRSQIRIGVDESGDVLGINLRSFPHIITVGPTGTGKSVFIRTVIEDKRAEGFMVFMIDGKGTDYSALIGLANVVTVTQSTPDHVLLILMIANELRARQADAQRNQRAGSGKSPFTRPPILFFIDEFVTVVDHISEDYEMDAIWEELLFIARIGRQFMVHMFFAVQDMYADSVSGKLVGNIQARISLGPPEDRTITGAFPQELRREVKRLGGNIDKDKDKGRGLVVFKNEDSAASIVEFQSFWGYSPAEPEPTPAPLHAAHDLYRTEVSEQIPKLYPRLWWAIDGPDYGRSLDHLRTLPVVSLDRADGSPDPAMAQFDPLDDDYLGRDESGGIPIPALAEMQQGATLPAPRQPSSAATAGDPPWDPDGPVPPYETDSIPQVDPQQIVGDPADGFDSPTPAPQWAREDRPRRNTGVVEI